MTRGLHKETKVQRGEASEADSRAVDLGYEPTDAPARGVLAGVGAFMLVLVVGLLVGAVLLWRGAPSYPPSPKATADDRVRPPGPELLARPVAYRQRLEAGQMKRLRTGPMPIDRAMRLLAARGWGENRPAPGAEETARNHSEDLR